MSKQKGPRGFSFSRRSRNTDSDGREVIRILIAQDKLGYLGRFKEMSRLCAIGEQLFLLLDGGKVKRPSMKIDQTHEREIAISVGADMFVDEGVIEYVTTSLEDLKTRILTLNKFLGLTRAAFRQQDWLQSQPIGGLARTVGAHKLALMLERYVASIYLAGTVFEMPPTKPDTTIELTETRTVVGQPTHLALLQKTGKFSLTSAKNASSYPFFCGDDSNFSALFQPNHRFRVHYYPTISLLASHSDQLHSMRIYEVEDLGKWTEGSDQHTLNLQEDVPMESETTVGLDFEAEMS